MEELQLLQLLKLCGWQLMRLPWLLGVEQLSVDLSDGGLVHAVYEGASDADVEGGVAGDVGKEHPQAPAGCQAGAPVFHHLL